MKIVCAWCAKEIGNKAAGNGDPDYEITHGICPACKDYFFGEQTNTMEEFLNRLDAPVLMVNPHGEVLSANDQALRLVGKDLGSVRGFRGGDVMECVYAKLPEGCGNTRHCVACTIRSNIMITFETGRSLRRVPAFLNRSDRHSVCQTRFLISTEKVGGTVLLRIDEIIGTRA